MKGSEAQLLGFMESENIGHMHSQSFKKRERLFQKLPIDYIQCREWIFRNRRIHGQLRCKSSWSAGRFFS